MKPKQAAALLTKNNQYLIHSVVKGVKGRHQPVLKWYQELIQHCNHLVNLVEQETEDYPDQGNCLRVMQTISAGMYSTNENLDICLWCIRFQVKLIEDLTINQVAMEPVQRWFLDKEGGFELCLHSLANHSMGDIGDEVAALISLFILSNYQGKQSWQLFEEIYKERFLRYYTEPASYVATICDMLPFIMRKNFDELMKSEILNFWIDNALRLIDNQGPASIEERIVGLTFVGEVWFSFSAFVDNRPDIQGTLMQTLRKCSRERSLTARIVAISLSFRLLDKFAQEKNVSAPTLYKSLIFTMIESFHDQTLREHYLMNFSQLFTAFPSVPIGLLIEPVLKQMALQFGMQSFDVDFFTVISKHPKLNLNTALAIAEMLSKLQLSDVIYATSLQIPLMNLIARFIQQDEEGSTSPMNDLVLRIVSISLNALLDLEKNTDLVRVQKGDVTQMIVPYANTKQQRSGSTLRSNNQTGHTSPTVAPVVPRKTRKSTKDDLIDGDKEGARLIKKAVIVQMVMKILQIRNDQLNDHIKTRLLSVGREFNTMYGYLSKGILALLAFFSANPTALMKEQIKGNGNKLPLGPNAKLLVETTHNKRNQIANTTGEGEGANQQALEVFSGNKNRSSSHIGHHTQARRVPRAGTAEDILALPPSDATSTALVVAGSSTQGGSRLLDYSQRNLADIDRILKKNHDIEQQRQQEAEKKRVKSAHKKRKLKDMLDKRKAQLGVSYERKPIHDGLERPASVGAAKPLIYEDVGQEEAARNWSRTNKLNLELLEMELQEQRDVEAVKICMKKFNRLWKNLFSKYANTGFTTKAATNFDQIGEKAHTINYPEVTKLLKDHGLLPTFIAKEELGAFFRLLNVKAGNKAETNTIDYSQYLQLIPQVAFLSFSRPPKDLSFLPLVESLNALIQVFREATRQRGQAILLYEDPDLGSLPAHEISLIKALNDKLKVDAQYPIPEGFMKVVEKTPLYDYRIPRELSSSLPQGRVIAIELLDEILHSAFGFHMLEPLVSFQDILKVKHIMNAVKPPQAEAIALMSKAAETKKAKQSNNGVIAEQEGPRPDDDGDEYRRPKLNLTLKLEVSKAAAAERNHIKCVAEVLEEMLTLLDEKDGQISGQTHLNPRPRKAPGKTVNEARKQKEEELKRESVMKSKEDEKRKKRKEELKQELIRLKEKKEKQDEEEKRAKEEAKAREADKKRHKDEEAKKRAEEQKKKIEEAKKARSGEEEKKKQEEESRLKSELEKRQKEAKEFMKAQKDKLSKEFQEITKEREAVAEKKLEIKKNQQEVERRLRLAMEGYLKDEKSTHVRDQLQRESAEIKSFMDSPEVAEILTKYDRSLRHLYKFYAAQDKLDWVSHGKENMNLREFVRFSYQHRVIPVLLDNPEHAVKLFKQAVKAEGSPGLQLDFTGFCKSLIRIAVFAQDSFGGQNQDLLSEKMQRDTKEREEEKRKRERVQKQIDDKANKETKEIEQLKSEFKEAGLAKQTSKVDPQKKIYQDMPQERLLEINENLKAQEEEFFKKWLKIREAKGQTYHLKRNASKEPVNATNPEGNVPAATPKTRKTKEAKMLESLANVEQKQKNLQSTIGAASAQVPQNKFDIKIITAQTIQGLLEFLGILPDGHLYDLDRNLDKMRIENQGQKPNKLLKQGQRQREQSREGRSTLMSQQKGKASSRAASRQGAGASSTLARPNVAVSESRGQNDTSSKELPPLKKQPPSKVEQVWNNGNPVAQQEPSQPEPPKQAPIPKKSPEDSPAQALRPPPVVEKKSSGQLLPAEDAPAKLPSTNALDEQPKFTSQPDEEEDLLQRADKRSEDEAKPKPFATMREKEGEQEEDSQGV